MSQLYLKYGSSNGFLNISLGSCGISEQLATIENLFSIDLNPFQTPGGTVTKL